jgi:hypothetical protein
VKTQPRLGIDFGGVIVPMVSRTGGEDTQFTDRFLTRPPQANAVQSIRGLVEAFDGLVWIVSKAGPRTESLTRQWIAAQDFLGDTGLNEDHLRFCRERQDKQPICSELGITHFVDDRVHIMQILQETVSNLYLFGDKSRNRGAKRWTTLVADWTEAYEAITGSL